MFLSLSDQNPLFYKFALVFELSGTSKTMLSPFETDNLKTFLEKSFNKNKALL